MAGVGPTTGLGSSLDVSGLVTKLMSVEQQPLTKLDQKEAAVQVKVSAFGSFKGAVSALQTSLYALEQSSAYTANQAKVTDTSVATASAAAGADLGSHSLEVSELAVAQRLKSGAFKSLTDTVGTGSLTLQFGTYNQGDNSFTVNAERSSQTITIDAAHNTLSGVRDQINAAKAGVTASIVNDGTGNRLVLTSTSTGVANSVRLTATDDDGNATDAAGLSQLAYDPTAAASSGKNMEQVIAAKDAKFTLDGLQITKSSNTVTDVLQGTTLNLLKTNVGSPTTLSVTQDTTGVRKAVDDFVKAYNELDTTVDKLTGYDAATKTAGPLAGDASIRSIAGQIRDGLTTVVSNAPGGFNALAQIGLTLDRTGQLQVNGSKLDAALAKDPVAVQGLFATTGYSKDSLIKYSKSATTTPAGTYGVNVSQLATQGAALGSSAAALTIDGNNDALSVTVNGTTTSVSLTHGTYADAAALTKELQSQLNGSSAFTKAGIGVTVTENAGVLSLTSNLYGSASKVELAGGSAQESLFGLSPTATEGVDVAGLLGSSVGAGSGQTLTSTNGLAVSVLGGSTGDRGSVQFTRGIAVQLDDLLAKAVGTKGVITSRTSSLQSSIDDIKQQRERIEANLVVKEQRYLKQFNTLDSLLTNMQSTMSYLSQQLSSLNTSK
ncbi:MAG: flagellar filament capping protein FliD [Polyangiales bacterium]